MLSHEPRSEGDGAIPGRFLAEAVRREAAAVARALPDAKHVEPVVGLTADMDASSAASWARLLAAGSGEEADREP